VTQCDNIKEAYYIKWLKQRFSDILVKDKVVPVYAIKAYRGNEGRAPSFVTSALYGGERSTSHAAAIFTPGKKAVSFEEHINTTV
jgi:hypothetical protein